MDEAPYTLDSFEGPASSSAAGLDSSLDPDLCYRALLARDPRFDGRFFTAVRSTRIYCRPVCPARTPRRENCLFVPCAAAAEAAGYRPCRRCRPESAPGSPAWRGTSATVSRALALIDAGALDRGGVPQLAERLGIGARHLRRLFLAHLGVSPLAVGLTRRTHFGAHLLRETDWPLLEVGLAAGFGSPRRFHEAIRRSFGCPPSEVRRMRRHSGAASSTIHLPARAPFDGELLLRHLASRAVPGVEVVQASRVRRAHRVAGRPVVLDVQLSPDRPGVEFHAAGAETRDWLGLAERVRAVFDLSTDPLEIGTALSEDPDLAWRIRQHPGLRVASAWDAFEVAVRIVLGQQISVAGASTLAGRIAERFGEALPEELLEKGGPTHLFPDAKILADAALEGCGLTGGRARALRELSRMVAEGALSLGPEADAQQLREGLLAIPGIGPWTADFVLLRTQREPDAFPASDLGLRRALGCDVAELARRARVWRPWRAYAAQWLWSVPATARGDSRR